MRCHACSFQWHAVPDDADPGIGEAFADFDDTANRPGAGDIEQDFTDLLNELSGDEGEFDPLERRFQGMRPRSGRAQDIESAARGHDTAVRGDRRRRALAAPLALVASLALGLGALYEFRNTVVRAVPPTAALYELAGLKVNVRGMEFVNVEIKREFDNGLPVLAIRGEIVNIAGEERDVPRLRFGLRDHSEQEIYHWTMSLAADRLAAEERTSFVTRLAAPPAAAHDVVVRFHDLANRQAGG